MDTYSFHGGSCILLKIDSIFFVNAVVLATLKAFELLIEGDGDLKPDTTRLTLSKVDIYQHTI